MCLHILSKNICHQILRTNSNLGPLNHNADSFQKSEVPLRGHQKAKEQARSFALLCIYSVDFALTMS